jgi:hypothetical protein
MASQPTHPAPIATDFPRDRRYVFVAFLFSLAVAEVARKAGDLYLQHRSPFGEALPAYCHLLLAALVITTSWVGWSSSHASSKLKVECIFSWPFVVLLFDVGLVVFYFVLVREAEVPEDAGRPVVPSAYPEALLLMEIFAVYVLWDVFTKAIMVEGEVAPTAGVLKRTCKCLVRERGFISLLCFLFSVLLFFSFRDVEERWLVVVADAALLCNVLLFRALKERDHHLKEMDTGLQEKARRRWVGVVVAVGFLLAAFWLTVVCGK